MKSKRRHQSSDESEDSEESVKSSSSSDSESDESSASEHRHKKKRKHAESSDSESDSDDQKRSKKRKHKKKKKKHGKKKKRSRSVGSDSGEISLGSEDELASKKKRKHKHKHSKRESEDVEEEHGERRLHSVVKERRDPPQERSQSRGYNQKEYNDNGEEYERVREVQRFYRGSSKERRIQQQYEREHGGRYTQYYQGHTAQYGESSQYNKHDDKHGHFDSYKRNPRYEDQRQHYDYQKRPREEPYHSKEDPRGYNRHGQYEQRTSKHGEYNDGRDYRERRGPPQHDRNHDREFPEKKQRFDDRYNDGGRDMRRERPVRPDRPAHSRDRDQPASPDDRYRRKPDHREEKDDRYRDKKEDRRDRNPRSDDQRPAQNEFKPRERKSRFGNTDDNKEYSWGKTEAKKENNKDDKEKPNFGLSGKLTADANTVNGVVLKYTEPDDAKQPKRRWRFYPFKGDKALPILYIHRQSCFVIGRDKKVVDIALDHPSISKQHAALQYRATPFTRADGTQGRRVRPYVIDLESANGTFVNNKKIDPRCYVELLERDVVKFGFSQREYVLLHENSKDDAQDDDNQDPVGVTTTDQIKVEKRVKQETVEDGE